jgi:type I restriction enzyme, S subunit
MIKKYPAYKMSEIEWIGNIPDNWNVYRLSNLVIKLNNGYVGPTRDIFKDEGVKYIQSLHLKNGTIKFNFPYYVGHSWSNSHSNSILREKDILIVQTGSLGEVALVNKEFEGSNCHALIIARANNKYVVPEYLYLLLKSFYALNSLLSVQTGALHPHLNSSNIRPLKFPVPPIEEQKKVVCYLDFQIQKIDSLISRKQKLIDFHKEERSVVINQAITKGIHPDVEMKDSGIDWLGKVPKHWGVKKIKYLVTLVNNEADEDSELKKIAVENIESMTGRLVKLENNNTFGDKGNYYEKGDVLFNKLRPYLAKVYLAEEKGICIGELLILRASGEIISEFLYYRLLSEAFISEVNSSTYGTKMPRASWDFIKNLKIGLPNIFEQNDIVDFIKKETFKIDSSVFKIQKEIDLLQEYRTALISEVVTGNIDVREEVAAWT